MAFSARSSAAALLLMIGCAAAFAQTPVFEETAPPVLDSLEVDETTTDTPDQETPPPSAPPARPAESADPAPETEAATTEPPEDTEPPASPKVSERVSEYLEGFREATGTDTGEDEGSPGLLPSADSGLVDYGMRMVFLLCIICAAIITVPFVLRRYVGRTPLLAGMQLGQVLGKVALSPKASLVYVKSGQRVLVVGVTQTSVSLVAEFGAEEFEAPATPAADALDGFEAELRQATRKAPAAAAPLEEDEELAAIRGDLRRLSDLMRESERDTDG